MGTGEQVAGESQVTADLIRDQVSGWVGHQVMGNGHLVDYWEMAVKRPVE